MNLTRWYLFLVENIGSVVREKKDKDIDMITAPLKGAL